MIRVRSFIVFIVSSVILARTGLAVVLTENFSSNPLLPASGWSFGVGDNSSNQFTWSAAPAQYTGDAVGSLSVHLDTALPTARLDRSLGIGVKDSDNFTLKTRFSFNVTTASPTDFMQIAFGLVNSGLTGGNRTGTKPLFGDGNTFHTVEFNYYPNVSFFGGPVLSPTVFGAQKGGSESFGNFAAFSGSDSDLGDNGTGITELPQDVILEVTLDYDGVSKELLLLVNQVAGNGSLTLLNTELPALSLINVPLFSNYDGNFPFVIDTLSIMAYHDAGDFAPASVALVADLTFEQFEFTTSAIPAPATIGLLALGSALVIRRWRRRG